MNKPEILVQIRNYDQQNDCGEYFIVARSRAKRDAKGKGLYAFLLTGESGIFRPSRIEEITELRDMERFKVVLEK